MGINVKRREILLHEKKKKKTSCKWVIVSEKKKTPPERLHLVGHLVINGRCRSKSSDVTDVRCRCVVVEAVRRCRGFRSANLAQGDKKNIPEPPIVVRCDSSSATVVVEMVLNTRWSVVCVVMVMEVEMTRREWSSVDAGATLLLDMYIKPSTKLEGTRKKKKPYLQPKRHLFAFLVVTVWHLPCAVLICRAGSSDHGCDCDGCLEWVRVVVSRLQKTYYLLRLHARGVVVWSMSKKDR